MATVSITLPDSMREFVEAQAREEGFETVGEYLRSVILDAQMRTAKQALERKLQEGLDSGPAVPLTVDEWDAIEREGLERAASTRPTA